MFHGRHFVRHLEICNPIYNLYLEIRIAAVAYVERRIAAITYV